MARCPGGHPLVIRNHPLDAEGRPFPTLYWLTCPEAVKVVSRLESQGWIAVLSDRADRDDRVAEALADAHAEYAAERGRWLPEAREWGGVGGIRKGVKCLHAHYANHLAGGEDPVGAWVADRIQPVHPEDPGRVAAVDLGTNSIRLIVAAPGQTDLAELARDMVITRIGQGVDRSGRLDPEALERTIRVLGRYCRRARALHARRIRVSATSAVRDAANRSDLEEAVRKHARSTLEVLAGEREAELSFLGATWGLDATPPYLVLDIGGGSTEFVIGNRTPEATISTRMGSVRLTERLVSHDPPTQAERAALAGAVDRLLDEVREAIDPGRARTLVAVAGTATTVQAVALALPAYDPEVIHRSVLTRSEVERVLEDLAAMPAAERAGLPVMAPGREDVIVAGATILLGVMQRFGFGAAVVSERDILDGLALEMLVEGGNEPGHGVESSRNRLT